jgi:hypothetical protein
MAETLPMSRTMTTDASEGLMTCVDLMVTLKAPKASPSSPTLEGKTTLETFRSKQRRWLPARAAASPNLHNVALALYTAKRIHIHFTNELRTILSLLVECPCTATEVILVLFHECIQLSQHASYNLSLISKNAPASCLPICRSTLLEKG